VLPLKKLNQIPGELAEKLELPGEIIPGMGSVNIVGGRRALVEGYRGILEYSDERVVLSLKRGKLSLNGAGLRLEAMKAGELLVSGRIQTVEWG